MRGRNRVCWAQVGGSREVLTLAQTTLLLASSTGAQALKKSALKCIVINVEKNYWYCNFAGSIVGTPYHLVCCWVRNLEESTKKAPTACGKATCEGDAGWCSYLMCRCVAWYCMVFSIVSEDHTWFSQQLLHIWLDHLDSSIPLFLVGCQGSCVTL